MMVQGGERIAEKWKKNKRAYNKEYAKTNTKQIPLRLNLKTDADIIEILEKNKPVQTFIKSLIRNSQS